jgi:hypothetical protein
VIAVALMAWQQTRHVTRVKDERRGAAGPASEVLADVEVLQDGIGYPTIRGRYAGLDVKLELVVDTLTMRQLPRLWLIATVRRDLPLDNPVDIVLRPVSTDVVSPGGRFGWERPRPAAWPEHMRIATPLPGPIPALDQLEVLSGLLHDERTKSVLVAPGGVRVVTELARGDVARHRVVRRADFDVVLEPSRLRRLLDDELELADGVDRLATAVVS